MARGLTLEELIRGGAKPAAGRRHAAVGPTAPAPVTYEQLVSAGARPAAIKPAVGVGETIGTEAGDTLLMGHADEAGALGQAALQGISNRLPRSLAEAAGIDNRYPQDSAETYREARRDNRMRAGAGREQNPGAAKIGTGIGLAASIGALPVASVGAVPGAAGRVLSAALTGAGYGAVSGLGNSTADLQGGEWGQVVGDVLGTNQLASAAENFSRGNYARGAGDIAGAGAIGGAGVGGLVGVVGETVRRPLAEALKKAGVWGGRKVIQGGSDIASATRKPLSDEAVQEVLEHGAIKPFSDTRSTYRRIDALTEAKAKAHGEILDKLEARGVEGSLAHDIADELIDKHVAAYFGSGSDKAIADRLLKEADNAIEMAMGKRRLGLRQQENIKSDLQNDARLEMLKQSKTSEAAHQASTTYRTRGEEAVANAGRAAGPGSEIEALANQFVPSKQLLSRLYEARDAAERGAVKAMGRQSMGNKDYLLGAATGDPATAFATAMGSSMVRNMAPSALAAGSYNLGRATTSGVAQSKIAGLLEQYLDQTDSVEERQKKIAEILRARGE